MNTLLQRAYPPTSSQAGHAYWLLFRGGEILVQESKESIALLAGDAMELTALLGQQPVYLGALEGTPCLTGEVSAEHPLPTGWQALGLRAAFGLLEERFQALVGYAWQILYWQREHRYCPRCGHPLGELSAQWARHCSHCNYTGYPPVTPAILVLIHDGAHILLARNVSWNRRFSVIAGFVEPGESLEDCVRREIAEEVGLNVGEISYVGSQPWPFPHQLMIGFMARYEGGQLRPDPNEIAEAAWFSPERLPDELPGPSTLARRLIEHWLQTQRTLPADGESA